MSINPADLSNILNDPSLNDPSYYDPSNPDSPFYKPASAANASATSASASSTNAVAPTTVDPSSTTSIVSNDASKKLLKHRRRQLREAEQVLQSIQNAQQPITPSEKGGLNKK